MTNFIDDRIEITHNIICNNCFGSEKIITSMDHWIHHRIKNPTHKRRSHVISVRGLKEELLFTVKVK